MKKMVRKMKKATIRTAVKELNPNETIEHYNAILIEDLKDLAKHTVDVVESFRDEFKKELADFRKENHDEHNAILAILNMHQKSAMNA